LNKSTPFSILIYTLHLQLLNVSRIVTVRVRTLVKPQHDNAYK